jgi:hypothetical protein
MSEGNWFAPFSETELLGVKSRVAIPDSEVPYYFHRLLATVDAAEQRGRDSAQAKIPRAELWDTADGQTVIRYIRLEGDKRLTGFIPLDIGERMQAAEAREAALREALEIAAEDVCGLHCISHWRTEDYPGGRPPHSGICETINKALADPSPRAQAMLAVVEAAKILHTRF